MVTFTPRGLVLPDPPTILVENVYQDPLFRTDIISKAGGDGTISRPTVGGPNGNGYLEYEVTVTNPSSPIVIRSNDSGLAVIPIEPGIDYTLSAWWYINASAGTQRIDPVFWDADGNGLPNVPIGSTLAVVAGEFTRLSRTILASGMPSGAAFMRVHWVWSGAGSYNVGKVIRMADAQVNKGTEVQEFTIHPITDDDGDIVNVGHLNANLDRISLLGIGGRPLLSSDRPADNTVDSTPGSLIYETDTENTLIRRNGVSKANGSVDANWRVVIPGTWHTLDLMNLFSSVVGANNVEEARVLLLGRIAFVHVEVELGAGGDVTSQIAFNGTASGNLPFRGDFSSDDLAGSGYGNNALANKSGPWPAGTAVGRIGSAIHYGRVIVDGNNITIRSITDTSGSSGSIWNQSVPGNWGPGDSFSLDFWYFTT